MTNIIRGQFQAHPFHLVSPSPWPIYCCLSLLCLTSTAVLSMHNFTTVFPLLILSFINLIWSMVLWFRDVISEGKFIIFYFFHKNNK